MKIFPHNITFLHKCLCRIAIKSMKRLFFKKILQEIGSKYLILLKFEPKVRNIAHLERRKAH